MPSLRDHIERNLAAMAPQLQDATAKQLAAIIKLMDKQYQDGRASCQAEVVSGDAVWVGGGVDKLIPLAALQAIEITRTQEPHLPAQMRSGMMSPATSFLVTSYKMDYTERV